ncbi:MAG: DUF4491 family protein [Rikenellaceae bacterium]
MYFTGIIIAIVTFLLIGFFHPIVIKSEYYWGVKCWWAFLVAGIAALVASLFIANIYVSMIMGVLGITCLWSILEIFEQRDRVKKGWFPRNPNRRE